MLDENTFPEPSDALNFATKDKIFGDYFHATGTASQVSSLTDMSIFLSALLANDIIEADTLALMLKRHSRSLSGSESSYGYGVFISPTSDVFNHSGDNDGFKTFFVVNPDKNTFIII